MSMKENSNITVGHKGMSICTPTLMGLGLRHNFGVQHSNISVTDWKYCRNSDWLQITLFL